MRRCAGAAPKRPAPSSSRSTGSTAPARFYGPAPQTAFDEAQPADRIFTAIIGRETPAPDADIEARLVREIRFDPDVWIVEVEDRAGRNFLDGVVT